MAYARRGFVPAALLAGLLVAGCGGSQIDAEVPAAAPLSSGTASAPGAAQPTPGAAGETAGAEAAPAPLSAGAAGPSTAALPATTASGPVASAPPGKTASSGSRPDAAAAPSSPLAPVPTPGRQPRPDSPAPATAATDGRTASDVGVTPGSIKLGTIGAISGAMPGQFLPSIQAAQAYFNMVNEQGGIQGRKVQLVVQDDALDGTRNLAAAKRLVEDEKVFALVSETSPAMDASAKYLNDNKVPDVGVMGGLGNGAALYRYLVPVAGTHYPNGWTSVFSDYGKQFGRKCGVIDLAVAISQQAGTGQVAACKQDGMDLPYRATVQVVQPDYTAEITRMRAADLSFLVSILEVNSNIRMMQAMRRQNYIPHPILFTGYDDAITETVPDVMEKSVSAVGGTLPVEPEWIERSPELALMQSTVKKYFRDSRKSAWTLFGWQGAMLFTEAARNVGPDLTREKLMTWLEAQSAYDFRGTAFPQNLKYGHRAQLMICTPLLTWRDRRWVTVRGLDNCGRQVKY